MGRALALAERGRLGAHPNPMVGAVIVRDGEVLGEGFHERFGDLHAERAALEDCRRRGNDPAGATVYLTLEPCAHEGKQPPCAPALVEAGVARVLIASEDPGPHASGRGPEVLSSGGVAVEFCSDELANAARLLNQPFRRHALTGCPHVILKQAFTGGGTLVPEDPDQRWVSGPEARRLVHEWRAQADAVCVGVGTVLADDPLLTVREAELVRQPSRVVFDSEARTPPGSKLIATASDAPVLVLATEGAPKERARALEDAGATVHHLRGGSPAERVRQGLELLGSLGIAGTLFEPGATLAASLEEADEIDELRTFHAGEPPDEVPEGAHVTRIAADYLVTARLREW